MFETREMTVETAARPSGVASSIMSYEVRSSVTRLASPPGNATVQN